MTTEPSLDDLALLVAMQDPLFPTFVAMMFTDLEVLEQFDRLRGTSLSKPTAPINQLVDAACGKTSRDLALFLEFAAEVWARASPGEQHEAVAPVERLKRAVESKPKP